MAAHTSAIKIILTRGARFRIGLRRGFLLIALTALAASVLAGAGYLLASTYWFSDLFTSPNTPVAAPHPAQAQGQTASSLHDSRPVTLQDAVPAAPDPDMEETLPSGMDMDARELRDQGIAQYKVGNYGEAVQLLEQSVNVNGDDPVAQYQLGLSYMAVTGMSLNSRSEELGAQALDDAELAFRSAIAMQPEWAAPYQMLAESLIRRAYYKDAISPALEATRLDPNMSEAWMTLGRAYSGAGMDAEARLAYAEAARYAPTPPQP